MKGLLGFALVLLTFGLTAAGAANHFHRDRIQHDQYLAQYDDMVRADSAGAYQAHRADSLAALLAECRSSHVVHTSVRARRCAKPAMGAFCVVPRSSHRSFWRKSGKWVLGAGLIAVGIVVGHNIHDGGTTQAVIVQACSPRERHANHDPPAPPRKQRGKCKK